MMVNTVSIFCRRIAVGAWAIALVGLSMAQTVPVLTEPPERRIVKPRFDFPERELSHAMELAAERAFNSPITDATGRIRYVVDLTDWSTDLYAKDTPPVFDGMPDYHKPAMRHLAAVIRQSYSIDMVGLLSWVGNAFVAYLTEEQVASLKLDARVTKIRPDSRLRNSGTLWSESAGPQSQKISWGTTAYGGSRVAPNGNVIVYVVDAGTGLHGDLGSVISRRLAYSPAAYAVGCYSHATAVAGVIAGTNTTPNSLWGMNRGTPMISYAVGDTANAANLCSTNNPSAFPNGFSSNVAAALDQIRSDIFAQAYQGKQFIVNVSANNFEFNSGGIIGSRFPAVANPATGYDGALIVMSAGNTEKIAGVEYGNACDVSYQQHLNADGIIVVGGFDENGQQAVELNGIPAYRNGTLAGNTWGSRQGICAEMWAPSKRIYTTWGADPQRGDVTYQNHARLSGTSFAAPHITALAAWESWLGEMRLAVK